MNIRRYFGRTNREALAALRRELGSQAVVLRNQAVDGGVELLAMPADALPASGAATGAQATSRADAHPPAAAPRPTATAQADSGAAAGEMSTLSFQQYVRERLARKSTLAAADGASGTAPMEPIAARASEALAPHEAASGAAGPRSAVIAPLEARAPVPTPRPVAAPESAQVLEELRSLRGFISEQIGALAWLDQARRGGAQARLLAILLAAGFSAPLARIVLSRVPRTWTDAQAAGWLRRALAHNLACDPAGSPLQTGGVFALVGPTGVGKTTTTAKLAARFALAHGVGSVGLVTLDAYRIGGSDQLRSYGRMLGVPVHVAHDTATLADLLQLFGSRKLVLIDTAGLGQRDQRVEMLLRALEAPQVRRLVVLNATAQVDTLDDVVCAYRAQAAAGVVLTKIDEAARLGGVLDCALRHRLRIVGLANGQRVPEDWSAPDAQWLVDRALAAGDSGPDLQPQELQALMARATIAGRVASV